MKNLKRLFCLLLVLTMLLTSSIAEVIAAEYRQTEKKSVYQEIPIADVSDMFVMEETEPEAPETEPVETQPAEKKPEVKAIKKAVYQELTYTLLSDNTCRIDGYSGTATELTIPETIEGYPVTAIGASAFKQMDKLESVTLPDGVLTIGQYAFQKCTALKTVDLGNSLITVGAYAFDGCAGLTFLELPDTVETIKAYAFRDCSSLGGITYPVNLKTVNDGYGAGIFSGCTALTAVVVPEGVTALPANVFYYADSLKKVTLPSTLTSIGNNAFINSGITSLELPDGVTEIGNYAFRNCIALQSIDLGESLISIGNYAFAGCTGLTFLELPDTVETIKAYAFRDCSSLGGITYPVNLKTVDDGYGAGIFSGCTALTAVVVPEGVTALPANVFYYADSLKKVTLPSTLTSIGNNAFINSGITSLELPDGVTEIGNCAFQSCTALESLDLGESLISIGNYAFAGCTGLTFLELPDTVETIKAYAFRDCSSLGGITYPVNLKTVNDGHGAGIFSGCTALTAVVVPEGVTALPANVFYYADSLKKVTLPSTLTSIGNNAFINSGITSLELPDGVTEIGNCAFQSCTALESLDLGESLISIGNYAFAGCTGLTFLELPDTVETINSNAFQDCENLANINYPLSLKNVGSGYMTGIFSGCTALTSVVVPEGVTTLPSNVFCYAKSVKNITLPSTLTSIGGNAFECSSITSLELPDGVTEIGNYAFQNCTALESIDLGESLISIGSGAFKGCTGLSAMILPSKVETIGTSAFSGCTALESFVMGDEVTYLTYSVFSGCTSLKNVHLSRKMKTLYSSCFANCTSLSAIYIPSSVTYIYYNAFSGTNQVTFLCALDSYAAEYALDNQIPIIPTKLDNEETDSLLNTETSYYIHNYDGLSAAGVMSMVVHYELDDAAATPSAITIHIYDYAALQENTMTLDGVLCTNYEYDEATGRLTVPVQASSGTLRFCLKPLRYEALTSYARLIFPDNHVELIGAVNTLMPVLNISARQETSLSTVAVNGLAIPETQVSLYVDGTLVTKVVANKVGDYAVDVSLGEPVDGKEYIITAEATDRDGNLLTAQTAVRYREVAPELQQFVMTYGSSRVSLLELQGKRPVITFRNASFRFDVKFTQSENLDRVFVVSNRNNVKKYLEAVWNEEEGLFVAEGYFDPNDHSYVPGALSVEYVYKGKKISFDEAYDFTSQEAYDALPQVWKDAEVNVQENTEEKLVLDVTTGYDEDRISYQMSVNTQRIPNNIREQDLIDYGYSKLEDDNGKTVYVYQNVNGTSPFTGERAVLSVVDFGGGMVKDYAIGNFKDAFGKAIDNTVGFTHVTGIVDIGFTMYDTVQTSVKIDQLKAEYQALPNMTAQQKQAFSEKADQVNDLAISVGAMKCTLTILSMGVAVLCPAALPAVGICSAFYGTLMDVLLKYELFDLYATAYGADYKFKWAIDPSGYVYDGITGERLEGVTVHAYWIENTGDDPDFWNNKPGEDEYGVLWDSMEYSQMNPLLTDAEGRYAWDVPEGWWRVSYEKEGYESTWSEWLPVPPPQTEVNIALMPIGGAILGDLNSDGSVDNLDVEFLLWYTLFPESYPISQKADYNNDGSTDNLDVEYLLWYTLFPEDYPLTK